MSARIPLRSLVAVLFLAGAACAQAAGALAGGTCGQYGTAYGYDYVGDARRSALDRCGAYSCRVLVTVRNQCAAFAVDRDRRCGSRGWAYAPNRAQAEELALRYCYDNAGYDCRVRAWVCDDRG